MPPTEGDDVLTDTSGDDSIDALGGNDTITVTAGNDLVQGGAGTDRLIIDYRALAAAVVNQTPSAGYAGRFFGGDRSVEYTGVELLTILTGGGNDNVAGGGGADIIATGAGTDIIDGGAGDDVMDGGAGADTMTGYLGQDVYFADTSDTIIERELEGHDTIYASTSFVLATDPVTSRIEVLSTTDWTALTAIDLTGNGIGNWLYGNAGANVLDGKAGGDFMRGFGGNDIYYADNPGDVVVEAAGGGYDILYYSGTTPLPVMEGVEELRVLDRFSTYNISLSAAAGASFVYGNNGKNVISGNGGGDFMVGYLGDDTYYAHVDDVIVEADGEGFDKLITNGADLIEGYYTLAAGVSIEEMEAALDNHRYHLTGNEFGQKITGGTRDDFLIGVGGADTLIGLGGNDSYGTDMLDTIVDSFGYDTAYVSASYTLSNAFAVEVLSTADWGGTDAIDLTANNLANQVYGNTGANIMDGKEGSDVLVGFRGADGFAFTTALGASNVDRIQDFEHGTDQIRLDDAIFTGLAPGALAAGAFVIGTAAADADDRILYNATTGALSFDADGNGAGAAVQFATLSNAPTISASDFMVI